MNKNEIVTIEHIKRQCVKVNAGDCPDDTDYNNLRRLQKEFARKLVKKESLLTLQPSVIKHLNVKDFPDDQLIRVRKYRISCQVRPSVYRIGDFRDLRRQDMPNYLKDFVGGI